MPPASGTATRRCTRPCQARGSSTSPTSARPTGADPRPLQRWRRGAAAISARRPGLAPTRTARRAGRPDVMAVGHSRRSAMVGLIVVALMAMLGGSSGHRETTAQAGIAGQPRLTLSATLADTGTATRGATALRRLPSVDAAVRRIGVATTGARSLQARHRPHVVAAPASVPSSATTGSVETPTTATAPAPAETTSAPSESEPVQTTSDPTSTTGGGSSAAGGGSNFWFAAAVRLRSRRIARTRQLTQRMTNERSSR